MKIGEDTLGVEYYLIQPNTKKSFYLGRGMWMYLERMPSTVEDYAPYEYYKEVLLDMIDAGCYDCEDKMEFLSDVAYQIYEFCSQGEKVRLISDWDDEIKLDDYTEVASLTDMAHSYYGG